MKEQVNEEEEEGKRRQRIGRSRMMKRGRK